MNITKILHILSHLRWVFFVWMVTFLPYQFINHPENIVQTTGTGLFIAGIMMGFVSLSDITKISEKQKKNLLNSKHTKGIFIYYFASIIFLAFISVLFLSLELIFPNGDKLLIKAFVKLGYDSLVLLLGILCLFKQASDQINYVRTLNNQ